MDKDFHYYGTYVAACYAGYSAKEAQTIADAAQYVDDSVHDRLIKKEAYGKYGIDFQLVPTCHTFGELFGATGIPGLWKNLGFRPASEIISEFHQVWVPFHFLPGNYRSYTLQDPDPSLRVKVYEGPERDAGIATSWKYDDRAQWEFKLLCLPDSPITISMINDIQKHEEQPYFLHLIGLRMHVLADTAAHEYYAGTPAWHVNDVGAKVYDLTVNPKKEVPWFNPLVLPYTGEMCTPSTTFFYDSVFYLGHGRMGSIPDYPWIKYEYYPRWASASKEPSKSIVKDNPTEYIKIFRKMVAALKYIKDPKVPKKPFDINNIDETIDQKYISVIDSILRTKHEFGLRNIGVNIRCEAWRKAISNGSLGPLNMPEEYNPDSWFLTAKQHQPISQTDYYKFNKAATIHLESVKIYLGQDGISLNYGEPIRLPPAPRSTLTSAIVDGKTKIYYLGSNNHVYEIAYNGINWISKDLTTEAKHFQTGAGQAPAAAPGSALTTVVNGQDRWDVFYLGTDNHVYELAAWGGGKWAYRDLKTDTNPQAQPAATGSALTSAIVDGKTKIYYLGSNNHVYEIAYNGINWISKDLTTEAKHFQTGAGQAPAAAPGSALTTVVSNQGRLDIFYLGTDNHVYELAAWSEGWVYRDLKTDTNPQAQLAATGSALTSAIVDGKTKIYYLGSNNHVYEIAYNGINWISKDLKTEAKHFQTGAGQAPAAAPGSALTTVVSNQGRLDIFYLGTDNHVYELAAWSEGWVYRDLKTDTNPQAQLAATGSALTSAIVDGKTKIYYLGSNNHVYEIAYNGTNWISKDLTTVAKILQVETLKVEQVL